MKSFQGTAFFFSRHFVCITGSCLKDERSCVNVRARLASERQSASHCEAAGNKKKKRKEKQTSRVLERRNFLNSFLLRVRGGSVS